MFMVPPVNLEAKIFLTSHLGYTMSKFGVGMMMKGLAAEFKDEVAFNSLWPVLFWVLGGVSTTPLDPLFSPA